MSLERDLKKAGIVLPLDSPWRRNFLVKGKDPLEARAVYDFCQNSAFLSTIAAIVWFVWPLIMVPENFDGWLFVAILVLLSVIYVASIVTMDNHDAGTNNLESIVKTAAMHLNISVNEMVSINLTFLQMRAESKLKTLAIELDRLRRDSDLDPLSIELPALQAKFKQVFDDFKLAKLIPEDATYARYFPQPGGKK